MAEPTPVSIVDIISEARRKAIKTLLDLFEQEELVCVVQFQNTLCVLQGMPDELVENVALPIIREFFDDYALSLTSESDVADAGDFDQLIAAGINAAVQAVMQQVRHEEAARAQARNRLLNPGVLRG